MGWLVVRADGGKGITRAVFVQGTGLSSMARTHTYRHARTLAKNRGLLWTPSPVGSAHYSHTLYHSLPLHLFLSLIFLSLSVTNVRLLTLLMLFGYFPQHYFSLVLLQFLTWSWPLRPELYYRIPDIPEYQFHIIISEFLVFMFLPASSKLYLAATACAFQ